MVIARDRVVDLTSQMDGNSRLGWDVPAGQWTVLRLGHTSTGVKNAPSPATGAGLECDKLSRQGIEANFAGMMAKLTADNDIQPGHAAKGLVATHIDSWENGSQNWTARMREEFQQRRGYDMSRFLPVMTGRVVDSLEISERFLWDLRRTISELVVENYAGRMHELAQAHGLRFTVEAYGCPCDCIPYGGIADEPMGEFWTPSGAIETCKGMACAGHVYGKRIVGAESFTSGDQERWREYPATLKGLGDRAFCEGINRFVFHRYAMQPWAQDRRPGMTMGPWGQHYERTETWWEETPAWHQYLARCQLLLRQGLFAADICYVQPEMPPQGFIGHPRAGYDWDECGAEVVLNRMSVKNGRIVLPDGMSYRLLVLPQTGTATPALLRKVRELVQSGATVMGSPPGFSPSLSGYPACDQEVKDLARELWGDADGVKVTEHRLGEGRVIRAGEAEKVLRASGVPPDFASAPPLRWIHRVAGESEIYFVASPFPREFTTTASFRVTGKLPELWWPDTGRVEPAPLFQAQDGATSVSLPLGPSGSVFVVFRKSLTRQSSLLALVHDGKPLLSAKAEPARRVLIEKARYGMLDDPKRTRDVRQKLQALVDAGESSFGVARMAEGDDPAFMVVKTLEVEYSVDGERRSAKGTDPEMIDLNPLPAERTEAAAQAHRDPSGKLLVQVFKPGRYELQFADGKLRSFDVAAVPEVVAVTGPWEVQFTPGWGAPAQATFDKLVSWTSHSDPGIKYYSGAATYRTRFNMPRTLLKADGLLYLDLGNVQVMAEVKLNGRNLGILWKPPFRVELTGAARAGENELEVKVVNLWPNRLIGDEQLPEDSERNPEGTLKRWPQWLLDGKASPTGRYTFTTWHLWKKGDALLESGLLGPVRVLFAQQLTVKPSD